MSIQELEIKMWNAAKSRDSQAFLEVVDENAVMVCGDFRCSGADYAEIIKEFDVAQYRISNYEVIALYVDTFEEVDAEYEKAVSKGAVSVLAPETEPWGQRTCYIADPEGNLIEIGSFNKPFRS